MFPDHIYANHTRDELWHFGAKPELRESRVEYGCARTVQRGDSIEIDANDRLPPEIQLRLPEDQGDDRERLRQILETGLRGYQAAVRIVSKTRLVEAGQRHSVEKTTTATIHFPDGIAITLTPEDAAVQLDRLDQLSDSPLPLSPSPPPHSLALVWRGGSGAVLLHEAIGHPAERETFSKWPGWLEVIDSPTSSIDDTGSPVEKRVLTAGQPPAAFRRQDFRSMPLRRLSNLVVRSSAPENPLPNPRIEVWVVGAGGFDPVGETVRLEISLARIVEGEQSGRLAPFLFEACRQEISAHLKGAAGPVLRYPGVICFDDGQYLPVGSASPDLITGTA